LGFGFVLSASLCPLWFTSLRDLPFHLLADIGTTNLVDG
jgi:hypothetical protein